jgi:hypothetical protein
MSYPVAGDPVYCTLANTYTLGSSLIGIGANPTGWSRTTWSGR